VIRGERDKASRTSVLPTRATCATFAPPLAAPRLGNTTSSTGAAPAAGAAPPASPGGAGAAGPAGASPGGGPTPSKPLPPLPPDGFAVRAGGGFPPSGPPLLALTLSHEALVLLDAESRALVAAFSFHRILCWGWSRAAFSWRAYTDDAEADVATYTVRTGEGEAIEARVMHAVQSLILDMRARAVPDAAFAGLVNALHSLAAEGEGERALGAVRQMALGRAFDARQAVTLLQAAGAISPFDKLEAALALFPALLARQSFLLLLNEFDDAQDRANILHRLGLRVGADGELEDDPAVPRRGAAARRAAPRA